MNRDGLTPTYFAFGLFLMIGSFAAAAGAYSMYIDDVDMHFEIGGQRDIYEETTLREIVLSAECATIRRGVFERSALTGSPDDLDCIRARNRDIQLRFTWNDASGVQARSFRLAGDPPTVTENSISPETVTASDENIYPVLVWDADDETYYNGIMSIEELGVTTE